MVENPFITNKIETINNKQVQFLGVFINKKRNFDMFIEELIFRA